MAPRPRGGHIRRFGRVDRRTVLRTAGAGLAGLVGSAGTGVGDGEALQRAYLDAPRNLIGRPLVVYREPERAENAVCEFDEPWRHPVVAPRETPGMETVYADLFVERRFEPGTVVAFVDRIQGCERDGTRYTGIFAELLAGPPDETVGEDGGPVDGDAGNETDDQGEG